MNFKDFHNPTITRILPQGGDNVLPPLGFAKGGGIFKPRRGITFFAGWSCFLHKFGYSEYYNIKYLAIGHNLDVFLQNIISIFLFKVPN